MVLVKACSGCINTWKPLHSDLAYSPKKVAVLSCSTCLHTILKDILKDRLCPAPQLNVAKQSYRNKQWTCSNQSTDHSLGRARCPCKEGPLTVSSHGVPASGKDQSGAATDSIPLNRVPSLFNYHLVGGEK